ncbi:MAG: hypothetical protein BWX71_01430 [Deltaproteobacteria bacterium ADurb.Bin072]|nr:MAG: hypothetical protein BWX71_01430 [Deltaproteobacteria bacterium ADurb.Bin072]
MKFGQMLSQGEYGVDGSSDLSFINARCLCPTGAA